MNHRQLMRIIIIEKMRLCHFSGRTITLINISKVFPDIDITSEFTSSYMIDYTVI